jgi:RNA polymerase sigma-70 factor, ECF subfamily
VAKTKITEALPHEPDSPSEPPVPGWTFRVAVLRYHGLVFRFANSLLADKHEAEDVTQETFLALWQHGIGIRRHREWLLRVTRNACLDRLRQARRRVEVGPALLDSEPDHRDPAWHARQTELGAHLNRSIGELPEPQRSLVMLFDVHGLDGATCARVLGISPNQVKVYLHRARRRLRVGLEKSL